MNKNLKIALIIAAVIAVIYFWKKKNSDSSEKSEFLGMFAKKGSQKWADRLASKFCALRIKLQKLVLQANASSSITAASAAMAGASSVVLGNQPIGVSTALLIQQIELQMQSIVDQLDVYGYEIDTPSCKAVLKGGTRKAIYKPGDRIGKDCLCKDKTTWAESCCAGWSPK